MKRFIDYPLRTFSGGDNININLSKFARARLTKFLKNKKYENLVRLSKLRRRPHNYMKLVEGLVRDWDKQELPHRQEETRLFMGTVRPHQVNMGSRIR